MIELKSKELDSLRSSIDLTNIVNNDAYYAGKNPAILSEKNKRKPDNKIPVALGYRLISNLSGYAARTGDIFINQVPVGKEKDTNDTEFEKQRNKIDEENNGLLLNSLLYIETLKQGISYDVVWTEQKENSKELAIKYAKIPNSQAVPVWNKELETVKTLSHFVRFWDDTVIAGSTELQVVKNTNIGDGKEVKVSYAQVFESGGYQKYVKVDKEKWTPHEEFISQPFTTVQVSAYRSGQAATSYIEPVMVLLDQMDKLVSRNMNEVERFNNSLLGILKKIDPETKSKIDQMGVIDNLIGGLEDKGGDLMPKFISREIPKEHAQMMFETIGRLIYEIMGSPNFTAESFGTSSGIALLYRLIGLEYSASEIDIWFDQGLKNRDALINEALDAKTNSKDVSIGFIPVIEHKRNLPTDIGFLAKSALDLKGVGLSMETILKLFPKSIIPDLNAEIERIEESKPKPEDQLIPPNTEE